MSERESRTKKIHYSTASFLKKTTVSLQDFLTKALKDKPTVASRYQIRGLSATPENSVVALEKEFINTNVARFGMFFGSLVKYESGANKHILTIDDHAPRLNLDQIAPQASKEGKRREFLDSILYFAVLGNHVVILQAASLRTKELEKHLNWLFSECGLIKDGQALSLDQQLTEEATEKIMNADTKKLSIGAPIASSSSSLTVIDESNAPKSTGLRPLETKTISLRRTDPGWNVLRALGLIEGAIGEQLERELNETSNLEIKVEISYKRKAKGETQSLLNGLTKALRHTDAEDFEVEFKGAGSLKGDKLILSAYISLSYYKGLVDEEDFYTKVHDWVRGRIKEGVIKV